MFPAHIDPDLEKDCDWFSLCPVCHRCKAAAPEQLQRCYACPLGYRRCRHDEKTRAFAIRRQNFRLTFSPDLQDALKEKLLGQPGPVGG